MAKNYRFNTNDGSNQAYIIQTSIRVKKNQENTTNHMHLMIIEINKHVINTQSKQSYIFCIFIDYRYTCMLF
jgi:hypothetical protein